MRFFCKLLGHKWIRITMMEYSSFPPMCDAKCIRCNLHTITFTHSVHRFDRSMNYQSLNLSNNQ